jgi:hypothetical protein
MNIDIKNCLPPLSGGKVYELTLKLDHLLDKLFLNSDRDLTNDSISLLFVNAYNNLSQFMLFHNNVQCNINTYNRKV